MEKLNLVWENNLDTPITASNLSKYIEKHSEDRMLFIESADFLTSKGLAPDGADGFMKFRANSRALLKIPETFAYFNFNDSLISHNSAYAPYSVSNIISRIESSRTDSKSVAIESGTTNLIQNGSFENNLTDWTVSTTGGPVTADTTEALDGSKSCKIQIDGVVAKSSIQQTLFPSGDWASFSLYYKFASGALFFYVKDLDGGGRYWNGDSWQVAQYNFPLNATTDWIRKEVKNINISGLSSGLMINIFSEYINTTYYIDSVQLEEKKFCSSFVDGVRSDPRLEYKKEIIRLEQGLIDILFMPKYSDANESVIFALRTDVIFDAIRLIIEDSVLKFQVFDTVEDEYVEVSKAIPEISLIDNWYRVMCKWKTNEGIKFFIKEVNSPVWNEESNTSTFTPKPDDELIDDGFQVGGKYNGGSSNIFEGLIDDFKINAIAKSDSDITEDIISDMDMDYDSFKFFENAGKDFILNT